MERLKNKVAIITGAAGGMGEAEARLFADESTFTTGTEFIIDGGATAL